MKKKVNISLDEEIAEQLKALAKEDHKPISQWVTDQVLKAVREKDNYNKSNVKGK